MPFTKEQIQEISDKLSFLGKTDSSFSLAGVPLSGLEEIAILQEGQNVRMRLIDMVNNLLIYRATDFINVSEKFNNQEFTLSQAIAKIVPINRKAGLLITFIDSVTHDWLIYQYKGADATTWSTISLWDNIVAQTEINYVLDTLAAKVSYTGATGNVDLGAHSLTAASLIKSGGLASEFLKADGSVDTNGYWYSGSHPTTVEGYGLPAYPTTLPASDVSSWAKNATKPIYTYSEVGAAPSTTVSFPGFGTTHSLAAYGDHTHSGIYQPVGSYLTSFTEIDPTVPSWAKTTNKPSYAYSEITNKPTTLLDYGITDTPWTAYLPLTGGTVTGSTNFAAGTFNEINLLDLKGTAGETGLTVWTLNSDTQSDYGVNFVGNLGANRKILRVGENLGSNGFTIDWIHSTSKFAYVFNQGDITVNGKYIVAGGTGAQYLMADGSLSTGTSPTPITLTVNGTSGAATLVGNTLNIPTPASVESGSYTPTLTNTTNVTTSSLTNAVYSRVGNIIHVRINGMITPTTSNTPCELSITLPFTTTNTGQGHVGLGNIVPTTTPTIGFAGTTQITNTTTIIFICTPTSTVQSNFSLMFDYTL